MKHDRLSIFTAVAFLTFALVGCGPSKEELAAKERQRLDLERQAERDAAKANKAITDMNKKTFSRMNASSPGATTTTPAQTQPAPETKKP